MCCVTFMGTDSHEQLQSEMPVAMTSATSTMSDDKSAAVCSKVSGKYEFLRSILCIHNDVIRMS